MMTFRVKPLSSLAKVFPDETPNYMECKTVTGLKNEPIAFQTALNAEYPQGVVRVRVRVESDLEVSAYCVECTPSNMPTFAYHDLNVLRDTPGLYPDLLRPIGENTVIAVPRRSWRSLWFELSGDKPAGKHSVTVSFLAEEEDRVIDFVTVNVNVIDAELPKQELLCTNWFHTDCLSTWYRVEPMSEEYWRIVENFARTAREHGITLLLTPIFTPALDTRVGAERPTVQLVDIHIINGKYTFNFDKLTRWIEMCHRVGIENFEIAHFFTQWGAAHTPKIMAWEDGKLRRIFGWETDSLGEEYADFIKAFAAAFIPYVEKQGIREHCVLHVSDEPSLEVFDQYSRCAKLIADNFPGFKVVDALSHTEYYERGVIKCPIPTNSVAEEFYQCGVEHRWAYYCCGQYREVSNRFFCMPLARTRVLGYQMYKFDLEGFLQWGFNFWYSRLSDHPINPFLCSDADYAFPSGDAYVVYPGEDGTALCSIRLKAFAAAINDLRALRLLESLIGREKTLAVLEKGLDRPLTFKEYPTSEEWMLAKREEINARIVRALKRNRI